MNPAVRRVRNFFVSLELTVVLLVLSLILVLVATFDQVNLGVWAVQAKYFHSFLVVFMVGEDFTIGHYVAFIAILGGALALVRTVYHYERGVRRILNPYVLTGYGVITILPALLNLATGKPVPAPLLPGGYLVGGLLLVNLVAAHLYRFKLTWDKAGIQLAHAGLILLLVGELLTGIFSQESFLRLDQGETRQYSESFQDSELVLIDHSSPEDDLVVAIPEGRLGTGASIQDPQLPFRVNIKAYYPNSSVALRTQAGAGAAPALATAGLGPQLALLPLPVTYRPNERNIPAAYVEIAGPDGPPATYLVTPPLGMPQQFQAAGRTWEIALRTRRFYQHFTLTLEKFSHDRYAGTDIPKNFSSKLRLRNAENGDDREVLIYMNNPLRYDGITFYQAGFENNDTTTILQVVRNPSWRIPYYACAMMGGGLLIQFGLHLVRFIRRRPGAGAGARAAAGT